MPGPNDNKAHRFAELKAVPGTQKLLKFNQFKAIAQAAGRQPEEAGYVGTDLVGYCSGGACAAFVMHWLADVLQHRRAFFQGRPDASKLDLNTILTKYAFYAMYASKGLDYDALKDLAQKNGFDALDSTGPGADLVEMLDDLVWSGDDGVGYYLSLDVDCHALTTTNHAVGVFRPRSGGVINFFDPNAGEYCVEKDNVEEFAKKYLKIMGKLGYTFGKGETFRVEAFNTI